MSDHKIVETGDYVTSKSQPLLNNGLVMLVADVRDNNEALIQYFDKNGTHQEVWLPFEDLNIVHKVEGGWLDL